MLILGIIASCLSGYTLYAIHVLKLDFGISLLFKLRFFFLPAIIFLESCMYWMVRKRNIYRKASWSHVWLFTAAYSTSFIKAIFIMFYSRVATKADLQSNVRAIALVQACIFWGLMVLAHIFFARLLIKIFSRRPAVEQEVADPGNMLDDILD